MTIFRLPDLGEGLPDAEISEWHVKVGDHVILDQSLVSMETAKAVVEVPSPFSGIIKKLYGNSGDIIKTGEPLVELESEQKISPHSENDENRANDANRVKDENLTNNTNSASDARRDVRRSENAATVAGRLEVGSAVLQESATGIPMNIRTASGMMVKATPAVRALAQRLNVNLSTVTPTGPNNTITSRDLEQAAKLHSPTGTQAGMQSGAQTGKPTATHTGIATRTQTGTQTGTQAGTQTGTQLEPGYELLKGSRRTMAHIMTVSHAEVVPVTVVDDAFLFHRQDKQDKQDKRDRQDKQGNPEKQDITVRVIQAIIQATKIEPALNVIFDSKTMSRKFMKEVHLGLAVDTPEGLFVPVIHNAQTMDASMLRQAVDRIKKQVSDRSIKAEELKGATLTLSNFGKFAGRYANPVVIPPTVAILGVGRLREQMIAEKGEMILSSVLPLSLTFDHRAVTGGEATRFLGAVIEALER